MAETAFGVTYKGPALEEGRMAVRDLAPALLALGDLFTDVSVLLYPDRKPVALNIQASKEGSFVLHLILEAEKTWDQVMDLLTSEGSTALVNLQGLVVGSAGLFALIKHLKGRPAKSQERDPASGRIRITAEDEMVVSILSLTFVEGNKWRLSDGERTFNAAIEDQQFIDRVDGGIEAFRKGDMLRSQMRISQSQREGRLHTEYAVVEVIQHIPREVQLRLDEGGSSAAA